MSNDVAQKDIEIIVSQYKLNHLNVRVLADRGTGYLLWETEYLNSEGDVIDQVDRKILPVEIDQFDRIVDILREAIGNLSQRRRFDLTKLDPPSEGSV